MSCNLNECVFSVHTLHCISCRYTVFFASKYALLFGILKMCKCSTKRNIVFTKMLLYRSMTLVQKANHAMCSLEIRSVQVITLRLYTYCMSIANLSADVLRSSLVRKLVENLAFIWRIYIFHTPHWQWRLIIRVNRNIQVTKQSLSFINLKCGIHLRLV